MAQFVVRQLEESVKEGLKRRAERNGRSMEEEVRCILRNAVADTPEDAAPMGARIARRFAGLGLDTELAELRGQHARPFDAGT